MLLFTQTKKDRFPRNANGHERMRVRGGQGFPRGEETKGHGDEHARGQNFKSTEK
jgi:hypothetical protein